MSKKLICIDDRNYVEGLANVVVGEVYECPTQFTCPECGMVWYNIGHLLPTEMNGVRGVAFCRCTCGMTFQTEIRWYSYSAFVDYDQYMESELKKLMSDE